MLLEEFAIRRGSGGTGRWHGGDGAVRRIKFREPMAVSTLTSHRRVPPYGLADGSPGALGHNRVQRTDGTIVDMAGCDSVDLQPGDLLVIETPGGGRYDPPPDHPHRTARATPKITKVDGAWRLIGSDSRGTTSTCGAGPSVYVDLTSLRNWISQYAGALP